MREKLEHFKCSKASERHGVGPMNGAYKDGWEACQSELLPLIEELALALEKVWDDLVYCEQKVKAPDRHMIESAQRSIDKLKKWEES